MMVDGDAVAIEWQPRGFAFKEISFFTEGTIVTIDSDCSLAIAMVPFFFGQQGHTQTLTYLKMQRIALSGAR